MSAPKIDVDIDERTKEALRPPCEVKWDGGKRTCPHPAEWVARGLRFAEHPDRRKDVLLCNRETKYVLGGGEWGCQKCGSAHRAVIDGLEPLR